MIRASQQCLSLIGRLIGAGAQRTIMTGCALIAASATGHAQPILEPYVTYTLAASEPGRTLTEILQPVGWQAATGPSNLYQRRPSRLLGTGTVQIGGSAQIGSAKAIISGRGFSSENFGNSASGYSAFVFAGWKDAITFSGGPVGERATVTFDLGFDWSPSMNVLTGGYSRIEGFVDINLFSNATANTPGEFQYASVTQDFGRHCQPGCVNEDSGFVGYYQGVAGIQRPTVSGKTASLTFSVIFGQSYMIDTAINADVEGVESTSTLDASHSLNWAGIAQVIGESGAPVAYSVTSASGFDYASAVPEPEGRWMLLLGLLALALGARRVRGLAALN